VSPGNKDRPAERRAFAVKCAGYLQQRVGVVVLDVVTDRLANLHAEVMRCLELNGDTPWESPTRLYAVAYRAAAAKKKTKLEVWTEPLALGAPLPGMPLWLDTDLCIRLPLEGSYLAACRNLRIPLP